MKPFSIGVVAIATAFLFFCTSFSSNNAGGKTSQFASARGSQASGAAVPKDTYYYFYTYPGDTFDAYDDIVDECAKLEVELQVPVDTNPFDGGIQIMRGYINNDYPHMVLPSVHLYAHYAD